MTLQSSHDYLLESFMVVFYVEWQISVVISHLAWIRFNYLDNFSIIPDWCGGRGLKKLVTVT